ncbi:MAG TPA: formate dehydrogenase accessory protein FdhE [Longimicrobiales bacterium]|nr:formate dehydrogenase accessory protein FdhE [Longimicrobiales bacterium]
MPGTRNAVRNGTAPRELSEQLERERPELLPWLLPLRVALDALRLEPWRSLAPLPPRMPEAAAPALHGATIPLDPAATRGHVHAVLAAAFPPGERFGLDTLDAAALLEVALAQDDERIAALADHAGVDADRLRAAAQLAALPVLHAAARALPPAAGVDWGEGYCPVCGALPLAAEALGLDRARQLRCGRCGTGWKTHVLLCPFCGETDHAKLGSLVPDGPAGQVCWVETCSTCHGYWKTRAVLRGTPADMLLLEDARTLELDIAAAERGFSRPAHEGFHVRVQVAPVPTIVS